VMNALGLNFGHIYFSMDETLKDFNIFRVCSSKF